MLNNIQLNRGKLTLRLYIDVVTLITLAVLCASCNKNAEDDIRKLEQLRQAYVWNVGSENGYEYIYKLKDEALKQKNDRYLGTAYYCLSNIYYYSPELSKKDSIPFVLEKAAKHYRRADYRLGEILAQSNLANYLIEEGSSELALNNIYSLLKEVQKSDDYYQKAIVYVVLGKIYLYLGKPDEALYILDKASDAYQKAASSQDISAEYNHLLLMRSLAAGNAKKYDLGLSYIYSFRNGQDSLKLSENIRENHKYVADLLIVDYLLDLDQLEKTEVLIESILSYINDTGNINADQANASNMVLSKYYLKKHDYDKALQYNNSVNFKQKSNPYDYKLAEGLKADILFAKGDYVNAFRVKSELLEFSDSIKSSSISKQLDGLENRLELEMLEKENELKSQYMHIIIISLSVVCILLIIILGVKIQVAKRLRRKNEIIFLKFRDIDKYTDKINETVNLLPEDPDEKEPKRELFEEIKSYLYKTEAFRHSDISRESLAMELGTNRQYLTQAIQENAGMTFMEYVTDLRLEYARRLLCYSIDLPIDEAYIASGFNSKSTFYRLFKQKYDLTPKEMRELAICNS